MVGDFETVHPNNREFRCYDMPELLISSMCLACNHSFVKSGQRIIFFSLNISLQDWIPQHQLLIGHRLNQELISILRYSILGIIKEAGRWIWYALCTSVTCLKAIHYSVSSKKRGNGCSMDNVAMVNGRGKLQDYVMTILDLIFSYQK
ncbi:hypothetical protein CK203_117803 [Vitis vinifera]|uniref:Uncharacterized protein n=1 Tax=Vitis vinifera TaxID=29760 RepID=A0A438C9C8_VITVI|nr:hypothetical protein CK203_117803 [Vitis vinifera]